MLFRSEYIPDYAGMYSGIIAGLYPNRYFCIHWFVRLSGILLDRGSVHMAAKTATSNGREQWDINLGKSDAWFVQWIRYSSSVYITLSQQLILNRQRFILQLRITINQKQLLKLV